MINGYKEYLWGNYIESCTQADIKMDMQTLNILVYDIKVHTSRLICNTDIEKIAYLHICKCLWPHKRKTPKALKQRLYDFLKKLKLFCLCVSFIFLGKRRMQQNNIFMNRVNIFIAQTTGCIERLTSVRIDYMIPYKILKKSYDSKA